MFLFTHNFELSSTTFECKLFLSVLLSVDCNIILEMKTKHLDIDLLNILYRNRTHWLNIPLESDLKS